MNDRSRMSGVDGEVPRSAVSIYGQDSGMDDFPVLKAFQQYIDAEQAKARKRIISLGIFFLLLTGAVIGVFVILLIGMSNRNQQLNDKILDYVMRDRERPAAAAPVVVQQPAQDNSALMALTARLEEMKRELDNKRAAEEKAAAERAAAERAAFEKLRREAAEKEAALKAESERKRAEESKKTAALREELEAMRLKALLAAEREKAAKEKERRREAELEAYRRKHYPELYVKKDAKLPAARESVEAVLDDDDAINYFSDDGEDEEEAIPASANTRKPAPAPAKAKNPAPAAKSAPAKAAKPAPAKAEPAPELDGWSFPES